MARKKKSTTKSLLPKAIALTIAGSDPSGGAGLQADLKTFQQLGVYGMSAVTLITVQNTCGVSRVHVLDPGLVVEQIDAVMDDIQPAAIKTGAMGNARVVKAVGKRLADVKKCPVVVDPVLVSKHGHALADESVVKAMREFLLPVATYATPNRFETERLTGIRPGSPEEDSMAIHLLQQIGVKYPLLKTGPANGMMGHILGLDDFDTSLQTPELRADNTHGTGCVLSAAMTAALALGIRDPQEVVEFGMEKVFEAINVKTRLGSGIHPAEVRAISKQ
jgi:hydroxymethylpyrimidine/phosphomethylpyrimidine kinase